MKYKFDQIAINSTSKKKPVSDDAAHYVGLEHLEPGTFLIHTWGAEVAPVGEKLLMKKGDVLFGRRRAYQRKVAIAPFDGIFSAHGMVLRPRTDIIDEKYFPFFIASDQFMNEAVRISVGSLSPTINWSTLKNCEFSLPTMDEQKRLADLLWAANDLKERYKQAIAASDEMLKAKFREMFGENEECRMKNEELGDDSHAEPQNRRAWRKGRLGDLLVIERGGSPRPISKYMTDSPNGINWIKIGDVAIGDKYITKTAEKILPDGEKMSRRVYPGDFLLSNSMSFGRPYILQIEGCIHDGWLVLHDENKLFDSEYLYYLLGSDAAKHFFETQASGSTVKNLNKDLVGRYEVCVPPLAIQQEFVEIARKTDETKAALRKSIADVNAIIKGLING